MSDVTEIATSGVAEDQLIQFVTRIESINEEIDGLTGDRKDIFNEAKGSGFDKKVLATVIRRRKLAREERQEQDSLLEIYEQALESRS